MLHQTASVSLTRFDHPPGAAPADTEEPGAERFQINVVERGWFRLGYESRQWTLGPGSVFISRPTDVYRYSHLPHLEPDACLSLSFSPPLTDPLTAMVDRLMPVIPTTNRIAFLRWRLCSQAADDIGRSLDSLACDLVDAVANARNDRRHLYRAGRLMRYARMVDTAREVMDADPAGRHSLWDLASQAAMSPFQFARVFRELIGTPPHRYLVRSRLLRARSLLEAGMSVTETCYAVGFNNLSHFIRTFRAYFGMVPSRLKASKTSHPAALRRASPTGSPDAPAMG